jgi:hypothetical protein
MSLDDLVSEFAARIQGLLQVAADERARAEILGAFGIGAPRKPGRPPKAATAGAPVATSVAAAKTRKKMPPQYCPVPYCRNVAAPVFGQVCAKHKDVPKAKIKQYRDERRAKKDGVKPVKTVPAKRAKRVAKEVAKPVPGALKRITEKVAEKKAPTKRAAAVAQKKVPTKRDVPSAKIEAKRQSAAAKTHTKKTEPIAKETAPAAPTVATAT